jgi:hypothetical protein
LGLRPGAEIYARNEYLEPGVINPQEQVSKQRAMLASTRTAGFGVLIVAVGWLLTGPLQAQMPVDGERGCGGNEQPPRCWSLTSVVQQPAADLNVPRSGGTLELVETKSWQAPVEFVLKGISLALEDDRILAWSDSVPFVLILDEAMTRARTVWLPDGMRVFKGAMTGPEIEIVSADPPRLTTLNGRGEVGGTHVLDLGANAVLIDAARTRTEWTLLAEHLPGDIRLTSAEIVQDTIEVSASLAWSKPSDYGFITADAAGLLWSGIARPFELRRYSASGVVRWATSPPLQTADSLRREAGQLDWRAWAGLPAVFLDSGYVQTLADLGNDRRVIIIYDEDGRALRSIVLEAAISFVQRSWVSETLVAVRTTDVTEIVRYRWRWRETPPGPS